MSLPRQYRRRSLAQIVFDMFSVPRELASHSFVVSVVVTFMLLLLWTVVNSLVIAGGYLPGNCLPSFELREKEF